MDGRKIFSASNLQLRQEDEDRFMVCTDEKGFETNYVGSRVIDLCKSGMIMTELAACLSKEFEAPEQVISADLLVLVPEMIGAKILSYKEG